MEYKFKIKSLEFLKKIKIFLNNLESQYYFFLILITVQYFGDLGLESIEALEEIFIVFCIIHGCYGMYTSVNDYTHEINKKRLFGSVILLILSIVAVN